LVLCKYSPFFNFSSLTKDHRILGIVLDCGGGPQDGYIGGKYFLNPGAFNDGFKGVCSVFVPAAFAFSGTEMVGLGAAETADPRKSLPKAIKQTFWRVTAVCNPSSKPLNPMLKENSST
jgi:amino acid permease